jgi:hypothetical protein
MSEDTITSLCVYAGAFILLGVFILAIGVAITMTDHTISSACLDIDELRRLQINYGQPVGHLESRGGVDIPDAAGVGPNSRLCGRSRRMANRL